ncbi:PIN domain-containing protein [Mesorhizobium sp. M0847]|uniref:type II toxin-antitoxin system VapC family toxin n=1 Tax=unclassified Mesorhizobium TaxID=325217 RepID=UPI003337A4C5
MPNYYWDACMWIALIQREPGRFEACQHIIERAQRGEVKIWTSAFTLAEVYKPNKESDLLSEPDDKAFEDYIEQDFVTLVQVDMDIGVAARRLLRKHASIRKPQDAIHIATALLNNVDELHTFDRNDMLALDGRLNRADGTKLRIVTPQPPPHPDEGTLLEVLIARNGTDR